MKEIYDWVPWFTELSQEIADGGRQYLAERAKKIRWSPDGKPAQLLAYGDENIDPFSFLYFLSTKNVTKPAFPPAFAEVSEVFGLKAADWDHAQYFPTGNRQNALFHSGESGNPDVLWKLIAGAVRGRQYVRGEDFESALRIPQVGLAKLTQTLFLINPHEFLPWDQWQTKLGIHDLALKPTWDQYQQGIENVRAAFPNCHPNDINIFSYLQGQKREPLISESSKFFQIASAPEYQGADCWENDFEPNNWVYTLRPNARLDDAPQDSDKGGESPYPLEEPKRGDIVLVRKCESTKEVHALGVVHKNDYAKARVKSSRIHMLWINKSSGQTFTEPKTAELSRVGFGRFGEWTGVALSRIEEYKPTLRLLKKLGSSPPNNGGNGPPPNGSKTEHALNRVLYGPPGTGKTFSAVRHALAIIDGKSVQDTEHDHERFNALRFDPETQTGQIAMVTFHQNYAYEDFVEGIRPVLADEAESGAKIAYRLRDGIFKRIADAASKRQDDRFVLIIDEINRGNIAKIFGELITLIEDSRRAGEDDGTEVTLPYSAESFSVPGNLYIIGTMNTADRSIQLLDTALRRRFTFVEMMPNAEHDLVPKNVDGVDCRRMLKAMNERITVLMDREHQIGHTYFRKVEDIEQLANAFRNQIFPLVQEYFFDDWGKIRRVLNDNGFVATANAASLLPPEEHSDEDTTIYERLRHDDEKWSDPEKYKAIYATNDSA